MYQEKKSNEKEQDVNESLFVIREFFAHSTDGMLLTDGDGMIKAWNKGFEVISGITKENAMGKVLWELALSVLPDEQKATEMSEKLENELKNAVYGKQQKTVTGHIKHQETGEQHIIKVDFFPVAMPGKTLIGGISRDVTEEVRSREILEQNERELSAAKTRLETLSDNLPEGTLYRFIHDRDTGKRRMEYVSGTWERVTGLPPEAVTEDIAAFDDIVHPDDWHHLDTANELTTTNLSYYNVEVRIRRNGRFPWLRIASYPYEEGNKVIWDGIMTDITDRKEAEAELATHREELEHLVKHLEKIGRRQEILIKVLQIIQSAEDLSQAMNLSLAEIGEYAGVCRVYTFEKSVDGSTINCTYEWCNKDTASYIESLQNVPIEVVKPFFDKFDTGEIICTSDIQTLNPEVVKIVGNLGIKSTVCLPLSSNGIHYGFVGFDECTTNRNWDQNEVELLKSLSQIISAATRRYRAETAMLLSKQTLHTVLDNINANIFVADFDTMKILYANTNLKKLVNNEKLEGEVCWKVLQEGMTGVCDFCPQQHLRNSNLRPTGIYHWEQYHALTGRWFANASMAIEWIDGKLALMEVSTDITDRKLAEIELIRAKEKAEESDKLKSAFLANVSHEVRTPLNGITGFLSFFDDDDLSPARRKEYINIVKNSSTQLVKLIDDIVDMAKIETNQMSINPIPVNINSLMKEKQMLFERYLQNNNKKHIELILDESGFIDNCVAFVDPIRLRQILNNLMNNAIKFTEKGYIRFGYRQSAPDELEFVVEDTGIGLAEELHEVIFERFRQAELTNNRLYGGTGLGLNIARYLVQMMGGDMRVESTEGTGSSFYFTISYLPVTQEDTDIVEVMGNH